jgi:alpha-L-fucosidase
MDGFADKVEYAQLLNDASEVGMSTPSAAHAERFGQGVQNTLTLSLPVKKPNVTVPVIELYMK